MEEGADMEVEVVTMVVAIVVVSTAEAVITEDTTEDTMVVATAAVIMAVIVVDISAAATLIGGRSLLQGIHIGTIHILFGIGMPITRVDIPTGIHQTKLL